MNFTFYLIILALIQLKRPIDVADENKGRICLPDINHPIDVANDICYVSGWGVTDKTTKQISNVLKYAPVFVMSKLQCNGLFGYYVDNTMICAGDVRKGIDSCQGDSGGSLVCPAGGKFT